MPLVLYRNAQHLKRTMLFTIMLF